MNSLYSFRNEDEEGNKDTQSSDSSEVIMQSNVLKLSTSLNISTDFYGGTLFQSYVSYGASFGVDRSQ